MRPLAVLLCLAALPVPAVGAETCGPATTEAYRRGFTEGVAAVNAQLGAVTAQMQRDVQAQVNAQLAELDARRTRELEARLAEAQGRVLADQGPVPAEMPQAGPPLRMPSLPPLTVAPGGAIVPVLPRRPDPRIPDDPAMLPTGTTITITDPQNLPPDLFRALMDHAAR